MNYITLLMMLVLTFYVPDKILAQPFTKKYILSFHHCAIPNCGGPQNHTVYLAESDDAENWNLVPNFTGYQGSVPDVITRGQKLYIYTPNKVKRYDNTTNQWDASPLAVSVLDSIGNQVSFADPSAYVDDNGLICLFFLNTTGIVGDPAVCNNPPCIAYFDSAVEVAGSDGSQFTKQPGSRIIYTTNSNFKPTDPDIFKKDNTFYQYISYGTGTMVYSSSTLHGMYTLMAGLPNGYLTNNNAGIPCGMYHQASSSFYSYGHRHGANGSEIMLAKHPDFNMQANYNIAFTGSSIGLGNVQVASPGICENTFLATHLHESKSKNKNRVYPNPTNGPFVIECEKGISKVHIFDFTGKIIATYLKKHSQKSISVPDLPKGLYIVHCYDSDHIASYFKIIVQ